MIGRPLRFSPGLQTILNRLSTGKLGAPGLLRVHRWNGTSDGSLAERVFGDVDLAIHMFASTPTNVYALRRADAGTADYVQIHLGFPNGGMALFDFSTRFPVGQTYGSLSLIGSRGAAYADDHHNTHLLFTGGDPRALISDSGSGHSHVLQGFVDTIRDETQPPNNGDVDCALTAHTIIDAINRSAKSGLVLREQGGVYEPA